MKEEEAKTKWCPMVRMGESACNTDPQTPMAPFYACRGSKCMMWESWEYEGVVPYITKQLQEKEAPERETCIKNKGEGDCGLKTKDLECNAG